MSISDRLAQEENILREIRLTLSALTTVTNEPHRRGALYASAPVTSGERLYELMKELKLASPDDVKRLHREIFAERIMRPNIADGVQFANDLRKKGFRLVIAPGAFFAKGWAQEHYMSLWRQVIERYVRTVAFAPGWQWSNGCVEELLIAIQNEKRIFLGHEPVRRVEDAADMVKKAIDEIDLWGFDPKPIYDIWRQIALTLEAMAPVAKTS